MAVHVLQQTRSSRHGPTISTRLTSPPSLQGVLILRTTAAPNANKRTQGDKDDSAKSQDAPKASTTSP